MQILKSHWKWAVPLILIMGCAAPGSRSARFHVSGQVVDARGKPLVGKPVQVILPKGLGMSEFEKTFQSAEDPRPIQTVTDSEGRFEAKIEYIEHIAFFLLPPLGFVPKEPQQPQYVILMPGKCPRAYALDFLDDRLNYRIYSPRAKMMLQPETQAEISGSALRGDEQWETQVTLRWDESYACSEEAQQTGIPLQESRFLGRDEDIMLSVSAARVETGGLKSYQDSDTFSFSLRGHTYTTPYRGWFLGLHLENHDYGRLGRFAPSVFEFDFHLGSTFRKLLGERWALIYDIGPSLFVFRQVLLAPTNSDRVELEAIFGLMHDLHGDYALSDSLAFTIGAFHHWIPYGRIDERSLASHRIGVSAGLKYAF